MFPDKKNADFLISYSDTISGEEVCGHKTRKGEIAIQAKYFICKDTLDKMAFVYHYDNGWIGINKKDSILLKPFIYDNGPDYVEEGLFSFVENSKIGFANLDGEKIISASFDFATPFENGLSEFTLGGYREYDINGEHWWWAGGYDFGYINQLGQRFKNVQELKGNKRDARTHKDNTHVLLNKKGFII